MPSDDSTPPSPPNPGAKSQAREQAAQLARDTARRRKHTAVLWQVGIGVVVVVVALVVTIVVLKGKDDSAERSGGATARDSASASPEPDTETGADSTSDGPAAAPGGVPAQVNDDGAIVLGNPDAKVKVQIVEDFQCPVCQQFEAVGGDLLRQYIAGDDVSVEYRGIAFLDRASTTDYSSRALNASACVMAAGPDIWSEFHTQLFLQQPEEGGDGLPDSELLRIANDAGDTDPGLEACITDRPYDDWVAATTNAAGDDGVSGTPTVFIDGKKLGGFDPAQVDAAVQEALAK